MYQVFTFYLSKSSSANHLQGLKVFQAQSSTFQTEKLSLFSCMLRTPDTFLQSTNTKQILYTQICVIHCCHFKLMPIFHYYTIDPILLVAPIKAQQKLVTNSKIAISSSNVFLMTVCHTEQITFDGSHYKYLVFQEI